VFSRILEALYNKVLINIVQQGTKTIVYVEVLAKKDVKNHAYKEFDIIEPNAEMIDFIQQYIKESPYYYVSFLDNSSAQGAAPTCLKSKFSLYFDIDIHKHKCFENKWSFYTPKEDLQAVQKRYRNFGIDYIFSPFILLHNFFKDKISSHIALFVLVEENAICVSVFEHSELLYARYMPMQNDEEDMLLKNDIEDEEELEELEDLSFDDNESIDLEDIDVDDQIEALEDFGEIEDLGDIEDLDALEDIDQFADHKDIEEELLESDEELSEDNEENFTQDFQRFSLIEKAIGYFYNDDKYESKFIENIYLADTIGVSSDLKKFLEEELFLNVYIRKTDICVELSELTKEELGI
jgi:hypothetical protein